MAQFYDYVPEGEEFQHMRDEMAGFLPDGTFCDYIPDSGIVEAPKSEPTIDPNVKAAVDAAKVKAGIVKGYCPNGCGWGAPEKTPRQMQGHLITCPKRVKKDEGEVEREYAMAAAAQNAPRADVYRKKED